MPILINTSGSFTVPTATYDSLWISNIVINAPNPLRKVSAYINVVPYNSTSSAIDSTRTDRLFIPDVLSAATASSYIANVMENIFGYVQDQALSGSISF